jgi:hypothetical protein
MLRHECYSLAWLFELAGGAIADFEGTCIPKVQREAAFTIAALHQWEMGIDDPRCVTSAEDVRYPHLDVFIVPLTMIYFPFSPVL